MNNSLEQVDFLRQSGCDKVNGYPLKAIISALLLDIVGTAIVSFFIGMAYVAVKTNNGITSAQLRAELEALGFLSSLALIGLFLAGLVSCYAGYYCAKISCTHIYRNVAIFAAITCTWGGWLGFSHYSISENLILTLLNVVIIFSGAYLWVRKSK